MHKTNNDNSEKYNKNVLLSRAAEFAEKRAKLLASKGLLGYIGFRIFWLVINIVSYIKFWINRFICNIIQLPLCFKKRDKYGIDHRKFEKLPRHLAVVISDFNGTSNQLTRVGEIIMIAMDAAVSVLTLYDSKGVCLQMQNPIRSVLENSFKCKVFSQDDGLDHKKKKFIVSYDSRKITVLIHSEQDGRSGIVNSAKTLLDQRVFKKTTISSPEHLGAKCIEYSDLQTAINDHIGFLNPETITSEPDLVLVFGVMSTIGFLPWHIRLSEIHWLPSLSYNTPKDVVDSFKKYSKCEQRVGK